MHDSQVDGRWGIVYWCYSGGFLYHTGTPKLNSIYIMRICFLCGLPNKRGILKTWVMGIIRYSVDTLAVILEEE